LAVSSAVTLPHDFTGKYFEGALDSNKRPAVLFVTIFPANGKTHILLSHFTDDEPKYSFLEEQLVHLPAREQKIRLTNLIMLNCENAALSPQLWNKLSDKEKNYFLASKTTNLYKPEEPDSFIQNPGFILFHP
jgi:hypothetical protein